MVYRSVISVRSREKYPKYFMDPFLPFYHVWLFMLVKAEVHLGSNKEILL